MRIRRKSNRRSSSEQGIALILTLSILAIVTLLAIAFAVSMRTENSASKNYNDLIKARELAQGAVDQAVALIGEATPPLSPTSTYVTSPGMIYTWSAGTWTNTPLFTAGTDVDLNKTNRITGTSANYTNGTQILVGWQPVVVDGKLLGRSAFWVDDESVKVNLNVAQRRGNDLDGKTPAAIDLQQLFSAADVGLITNYAGIHSYDTPETVEIPLPPAGGVTKYTSNQFYMTVSSSSPDVTQWGAKRTNIVWVATNTTMTADQKVTAIANSLSDPNLKTWFSNKTFADKYPSVQQIAANIIDYIDADSNCTDLALSTGLPATWDDTTPPLCLGLELNPYLSEIDNSNVFTVAANGTDPSKRDITWTGFTQVELWNMYTNNWQVPANTEILITNIPPITLVVSNVDTGVIVSNSVAPPPSFSIPLPAGTVGAATYVLYPPAPQQDTFTLTVDTNTVVTMTYGSNTVTAILRVSSGPLAGRLDYAALPMAPKVLQGTATISTLGVLTPANAAGRARISEVNDPRVKPVSIDWRALTTFAAAGTPGGFNNGVLDRQVSTTNNPPVGLRADGDDSCHIISGSRDRGTMYPGELGYIHTGVSWRTFWLQPQYPTEVGSIPDWAVLDLFSASDAANPVGRMNINAWITPYSASNAIPQRLAPLSALMTNGLAGSTFYVESNVVSYIYDPAFDLTKVTTNFPSFATNVFASVGEVCEIQGLATNDVSTSGLRNKSLAETPVRGIANLITPRSDTFTIWAIAQSIKDVNANGTYDPSIDIITGEAKVQAIVQRFEQGGQVKFRTLYYRYIYE